MDVTTEAREPVIAADDRRQLEVLADTLWAERHVVELLLYRLTTARLMLAADERRFVSLALDEVERVVEVLRGAEARRSQVLAAIAGRLEIRVEDLTLAQLAASAPEPMRSVFRDHQEGFRTLAAEIDECTATNRRLASAALGSLQ